MRFHWDWEALCCLMDFSKKPHRWTWARFYPLSDKQLSEPWMLFMAHLYVAHLGAEDSVRNQPVSSLGSFRSVSLPPSPAAMSKSLDFSWSRFPCLNLGEVQEMWPLLYRVILRPLWVKILRSVPAMLWAFGKHSAYWCHGSCTNINFSFLHSCHRIKYFKSAFHINTRNLCSGVI